MTDLVFSEQIKERQKFFPWLKVFQRKLLKSFSNDLDFDILQFLLQNVEEEVTTLPKSGKTKRKEALFETIYDLFLHFWWRIRWNGRKKWSRWWKNVSSDVSYTKDECSKCCEKLLYYIIHLGITLSQGCLDTEWIGKVFQVIHILPIFDSMVHNALLQVNKLSKKCSHTYLAILKHVLCSEVAMSITEPAAYIKIMLLFRRLKKCTDVEFTISTIESIISRIKPPSDIMQWMLSQAIDFPLEKHESFCKKLLRSKSNDLFHKLYHVVTTPVQSKKKIYIRQNQNEGIETQHNKAKVKKCKHKKKSHSKLQLRDSQLNLSVDGTSVCLNSPVHLEGSTSSNCKMQANTTINIKSKKHKKKSSQDLLDEKVHENTRMIGATAMNEFLNLSFAEISNFSKRLVSQKQNIQHVSEGNDGIESNNIPKKGTLPNESIVIKNITSYSNEECDLAKSCNGQSNRKKIKLDSNDKIYKQNPSIQQSNLLQSAAEATCLNSLVTLCSNKLKGSPLNTSEILSNACTNESTDVSDQVANITQNLLPYYQCPSNSNLLYTKTSVNMKSSSQMQTKQTSPDKIQFVSPVDIQKIHPSALLKLVQLPYEDSTSRHCEMLTNTDNHPNTDNSSMSIPASGSASIIRAPKKLKALCDAPPNVFPESNNTIQTDADRDKAMSSTELIDGTYLSKNVNENICRNGEINFNHISSGNSSVDLCKSLNNCASFAQNKSNSSFLNELFDDHRWGQSQPLIPTINRSLEPTQNCLVNSMKSSCVNSEAKYGSSFVTPRAENRLGNVTVSQNDTSPNCVVDCKIVSDFEPNKIQNESFTSFKVVINVSCKTPDDTPNQQSEHIFGNFNNASENYFDSSQNLFVTANPTPEMPKLTPFYDDPPILSAMTAVDTIATPPDSELEISIPASSSKQSEAETLTNTFFEKPQNKPNCSSTPKDTQNTIPKRISKDDSDFRTPQTSDCESTSSECNMENVNMTRSPVTRTSTVKSPVDDILERLNYRIRLPSDKSESHIATTAQNASKENVSYRSFTDGYSYDELSENSTISVLSRVSVTDDELNENIPGQSLEETNIKTSDISKPRQLKVFKKRKNSHPKKFSGSDQNRKDIEEGSSCNFSIVEPRLSFLVRTRGRSDKRKCRIIESCKKLIKSYNLRPRKHLSKPSNLDDFF